MQNNVQVSGCRFLLLVQCIVIIDCLLVSSCRAYSEYPRGARTSKGKHWVRQKRFLAESICWGRIKLLCSLFTCVWLMETVVQSISVQDWGIMRSIVMSDYQSSWTISYFLAFLITWDYWFFQTIITIVSDDKMQRIPEDWWKKQTC